MNLKSLLIALFLIAGLSVFYLPLYGQVAINQDDSPADSSAILDIKSIEKGLLIPRMTTSQRNAIPNPANGLLVYDETTSSFWFYQNSVWIELIAGSVTTLVDADEDTKIQVEKNADEDMIRFDLGGTEFLRLDSGRLDIKNTGNSIFIGDNAGINDDLDDSKNIGIGTDVLGENDGTAFQNIAIGREVLSSLTSGWNNTIIGDRNERLITQGVGNTSIGTGVRGEATDGNYNTGVGLFALQKSNSNANVAIGHLALKHAGFGNVAVGVRAGETTTGEKNIFLGLNAGQNETGSNRLYIDNSNTTKPLLYGELDNDLLRINGILDIDSAYQFPTTDGLVGQFLSTDGFGNVTWQNSKDQQHIDSLFLTGNQLNISLENDGVATQKVDMSSLQDADWLQSDGTIPANIGNSIYRTGNVGIGAAAASPAFPIDAIGKGGERLRAYSQDEYFAGYIAKNNTREFFMGVQGTHETSDASSGFHIFDNTAGERRLVIDKDGDVGIGHSNPNAKLHVNGDFRLEDGTQGDGKVLTSNDSGFASWQTLTDAVDDADADPNNEIELPVGGISGQFLHTDGTGGVTWQNDNDQQVIDTIALIGNSLILSLQNDNQAIKSIDFSGINTDNQMIDELTLSNDTLFLSLENDGVTPLKVDLGNISKTHLVDKDGDTKIHVEESADEDIIRFDLGGTEYFRMNSNARLQILNSGRSVFIGNLAGDSDNLSNNLNVFVGEQAGQNNVSGKSNIAIGPFALSANTNGQANVGIGRSANAFGQSGFANTAIGYLALRENTADYNTALGAESMTQQSTGAYNVAIGYQAGYNNSAGSSNIFLGNQAGYNELNSNRLYIENSNADSTNALIYGDFAQDELTVNGSLEINDTTNATPIPLKVRGRQFTTLLVEGNTNNSSPSHGAALQLDVNDNYRGSGVFMTNRTDNKTWFAGTPYQGSGDRYNIGFVNSTSYNFSGYNSNSLLTILNTGNATLAGTLMENSDISLKKDFSTIKDPLKKLSALSGYYYYWKDRPDSTRQIGLIAQEVEKQFPELVQTDESSIKSVAYGKLTAFLIEVNKAQELEKEKLKNQLQQQQTQIDRLNTEVQKIAALEKQNQVLQQILEKMQSQLSNLTAQNNQPYTKK